MRVLTLSIKQNFFEEIIAGTKTQEFREIRPSSQAKYCEVDEEGYAVEKDGVIMPRKYDAIKFLTGAYNKGPRPYMIVEVKDANIELFVNEKDEFIELEQNGVPYLMAQVVYDLGKIIEKS